jgi:hypothetical protein
MKCGTSKWTCDMRAETAWHAPNMDLDDMWGGWEAALP